MVRGSLGAALATVVALLCAAPAQAVTKTVTFDDLAADTDVSTQYQASHGVFFQGPTADGAFPKTLSSTRAHSGAQVGDIPQLAESFKSRTVGRLNPTARTVSAFVGFTGDPDVAEGITLTAYNSNNQSVGTSTVTVNPGASSFTQQVSVTSPNVIADISYFELKGDGSG